MSKVLRDFRVNDADAKVYIKAQKPSGSRLGCHQWPCSKEEFSSVAAGISLQVEALIPPDMKLGQSISLVGKIDVPGVKVRRGYIEDGKAWIEIETGESTSPY